MGRIIGIDLGTTNTAVAVLDGGKPRVLADERGYRVLPSVIASKGQGRFVVGQAAASMMLTRPERTVYAVKRLIGRKFEAAEVAEVAKRVHYKIRQGADGGCEVQIEGEWFTPQQISAVVLQVARGIAEKALNDTIDEAVITVPAYFNHAQRQATLEAAQLAGLRCERLLNEPTAAALAYGHRRNVDRRLVVFDLGGGTFDISILRVRDGIYEILATGGDTFLGGEDFDYRILDEVCSQHQRAHGFDPRTDRDALQRVKEACERAKCELSFAERSSVSVPHVGPGQTLDVVLTRQGVERLTSDLIDRCIAAVSATVSLAGLKESDIDDVLLVGGMTRMPAVRDAVQALFQREPNRSVHPEEAVACGAAVHAGSLEDAEAPRAVLLDVTPFDLGIEAVGGTFATVIPRNHRIPCSETRVFATARDDQDSVRVTVRQGENRQAAANEFLGEFVFDGLPTGPRMQTKIAVTFRIDANGVLHVSAKDAASGEKRNMTIRNYAEVALGTGAVAKVEVELPPGATPPPSATAPSTSTPKPKTSLLDAIFGRRKAAERADAKAPPTPAAAPSPTITPAERTVPPSAPAESVTVAPVAPVEAAAPPASDADAPAEPGPVAADLVPIDDQELLEELGEGALVDDDTGMGFALADADAEPMEPETDATAFALPGDDDMPSALSVDDLFGDAPAPLATPDLPSVQPADPDEADEADEDADDPPTDRGTMPTLQLPPEPAGQAPAEAVVEFDESDLGDMGLDVSDLFGDEALAEALRAAEASTLEPPVEPPVEDADAGGGFAFVEPDPPADDARADDDAPAAAAEPLGPEAKKPATLRFQFHDHAEFIEEYRAHLSKNGMFVPTERTLAVGRACIFEIRTPGLSEVLVLRGVVRKRSRNPRGIHVEYTLDDESRMNLAGILE